MHSSAQCLAHIQRSVHQFTAAGFDILRKLRAIFGKVNIEFHSVHLARTAVVSVVSALMLHPHSVTCPLYYYGVNYLIIDVTELQTRATKYVCGLHAL
jgi:hypothetical protein